MLKVLDRLQDVDFAQLKIVYSESIATAAKCDYPELTPNLQLINAEQDFYAFISLFFTFPKARIYVLTKNDAYLSAMRMEAYQDGLLMEALETAAEHRRCGLAKELIKCAILCLSSEGHGKLYSHVAKDNLPSLAVHRKCGFRKIADDAIYVDGTRHDDSTTFCYEY